MVSERGKAIFFSGARNRQMLEEADIVSTVPEETSFPWSVAAAKQA